MQQYLYRIQPRREDMLKTGPSEQEREVIEQHFRYLKRLSVEGIVWLAGRTATTDSGSFGIVIFQAASEEAARDLVESDPAVQQQVMRAELFPWRTALANVPKPLPVAE
jgi:uncharacterized protein YciI